MNALPAEDDPVRFEEPGSRWRCSRRRCWSRRRRRPSSYPSRLTTGARDHAAHRCNAAGRRRSGGRTASRTAIALQRDCQIARRGIAVRARGRTQGRARLTAHPSRGGGRAAARPAVGAFPKIQTPGRGTRDGVGRGRRPAGAAGRSRVAIATAAAGIRHGRLGRAAAGTRFRRRGTGAAGAAALSRAIGDAARPTRRAGGGSGALGAARGRGRTRGRGGTVAAGSGRIILPPAAARGRGGYRVPAPLVLVALKLSVAVFPFAPCTLPLLEPPTPPLELPLMFTLPLPDTTALTAAVPPLPGVPVDALPPLPA